MLWRKCCQAFQWYPHRFNFWAHRKTFGYKCSVLGFLWQNDNCLLLQLLQNQQRKTLLRRVFVAKCLQFKLIFGARKITRSKKIFLKKDIKMIICFFAKNWIVFFHWRRRRLVCQLWSEDHVFLTGQLDTTMIDKTGSVQIFHPLWRLQWDWCCVASSVEENSAPIS